MASGSYKEEKCCRIKSKEYNVICIRCSYELPYQRTMLFVATVILDHENVLRFQVLSSKKENVSFLPSAALLHAMLHAAHKIALISLL